jgi:mannan endo-1,4-beta-mannosidase
MVRKISIVICLLVLGCGCLLAKKKTPPLPEKPVIAPSKADPACLDRTVPITNRQASPETKQVLGYLRDLPRRQNGRLLAGQFIGGGNWSGFKEIDKIHEKTGKWLSLIGNDYALMHDTSTEGNGYVIDYWNRGGLVTISFHALNPEHHRFGSVKNKNINFSSLFDPGSKAYQTWMKDLDRVAEGLAKLQEYGVVVLWRPFHEMNKNFFWWGQRDVGEFVRLWRHMYDYFTHEKKLNNLLWVYSPYQSNDTMKYYPGDAYVDVVGLDAYETNPEKIQGYEELAKLDKPFGFTEYGPSGSLIVVFPKIEKNVDYNHIFETIKHRFPKTSFVHAWNGGWGYQDHRNIDHMLNNPDTITLEKVNWRAVCASR